VRARLREVAGDRVVVRVRRGACAPARVVLRADGRRVLSRLLRRRGWQTLKATVPMTVGNHELSIGLARSAARRRCAPRLHVDSIELRDSRPPGHHHVLLGAAVRLSALEGDPAYKQTFLKNFDSLTPENEMKMNFLQPALDTFGFGDADQLVSFAQAHGKTVHGHELVWGEQLPLWLTGRMWPRSTVLEIMKAHVAAVVSHYRGKVAEWDVVNEPMAADGTIARNFWSDAIGPSYIEEALSAAHDADPAAKLFINETGAERPGPKADGLIALAQDLRARHIPLDGIGLQNHTNVQAFPTRAQLENVMGRIAALGLSVEITEMDVAGYAAASPQDRDALQTAAYREAAVACEAVPACTRMTIWGVDDRYSWLGDQEHATLFDDAFDAKPAFDAVRAVLGG
jgi:endo-1,4-beta-xylanase